MVTEYERAKSRKSYLKNRTEVLRRSKERYLANREKCLAQNKAWREANPEARKRSWRKRQANHREKCRQANREWYQRNLEQQRMRNRLKGRKLYLCSGTELRANAKKWRDLNKDKVRTRDMRRRALLKGAKVNLANMREWMASVKSRPYAKCYYCDRYIPSDSIHFDHIVALKNGGEHSVFNLCVSCSPCNLSKKDKSISAWVRIGQQILPL